MYYRSRRLEPALLALACLAALPAAARAGVCQNGQTQSCSIGGCAGTRYCEGGYWSPCECPDEPPEPEAPTFGITLRSIGVGGNADISVAPGMPKRTALAVPKTFSVEARAFDNINGVGHLTILATEERFCTNRSHDDPALGTSMIQQHTSLVIGEVGSYSSPSLALTRPFAVPRSRECPPSHPIFVKADTEIWATAERGNASWMVTALATFTYYSTLTVVSYNVQVGCPGQTYCTAAIQAPILRHLQPDVILLQETSVQRTAELAAALALPYYFTEIRGGDGQGIISRFPLAPHPPFDLPRNTPLSACNRLRWISGATVSVGGPCAGPGCPTWSLPVYDTHLMYIYEWPGPWVYPLPCDTWANQAEQAAAVVEHIGCANPLFTLGGDFNAHTYDWTVEPVFSCWTNAFHALPNRFGLAGPNEHWGFFWGADIDQVFMQGVEVLKASWLEQCPTCPDGSGGGSDHAPVATTIRRPGH
jgi:endonuclease/exonuclease/phosphatase family metal-dependent hydrolase